MNQRLAAWMRAAGLRADRRGVCMGYAQMAGMAILAGDMSVFDMRAKWIGTHEPEKLHYKSKKKAALQEQERIAIFHSRTQKK
jgi:hypothetical protein